MKKAGIIVKENHRDTERVFREIEQGVRNAGYRGISGVRVEAMKMLAMNEIFWRVSRILKVYPKLWPGTETFHRDSKQRLGSMGECQMREGREVVAHRYLHFEAYTQLMSNLRQGRSYDWAVAKMTTIGAASLAVFGEAIRKTIDRTMARMHEGRSPADVHTILALV